MEETSKMKIDPKFPLHLVELCLCSAAWIIYCMKLKFSFDIFGHAVIAWSIYIMCL